MGQLDLDTIIALPVAHRTEHLVIDGFTFQKHGNLPIFQGNDIGPVGQKCVVEFLDAVQSLAPVSRSIEARRFNQCAFLQARKRAQQLSCGIASECNV